MFNIEDGTKRRVDETRAGDGIRNGITAASILEEARSFTWKALAQGSDQLQLPEIELFDSYINNDNYQKPGTNGSRPMPPWTGSSNPYPVYQPGLDI